MLQCEIGDAGAQQRRLNDDGVDLLVPHEKCGSAFSVGCAITRSRPIPSAPAAVSMCCRYGRVKGSTVLANTATREAFGSVSRMSSMFLDMTSAAIAVLP